MNEEQKADFLAYEELKIKEKEIKNELEILKEKILPLVHEGEKIVLSHGAIEMGKRDNWTYSDETQVMEKQLKEKQKYEIASGVAISKPTIFITYRENKE